MILKKSLLLEGLLLKVGARIQEKRILNLVEEVKDRDIRDAFTYLSEITGNEVPYSDFEEALSRAREQQIPLDILSFQGDNKRRPKASSRLDNPIIVVHTGDDKYPIIDGNHRYLQHKNMGKETILGIILELPLLKRSKDKRRWVWWG